MGIFLVYILKSSFCLSLFYLFYRLLLSKETFHRFNRIALLGILLLSLLIPFVEVTTSHQTELTQTMLTIEQLLMMAETVYPMEAVAVVQPETVSISWIQVLLLIYMVGILFFSCRNLYSLSRLILLIKSGKRERLEEGIVLIIIDRDVAPFSWMKYIVISRKDLEEDGREILIHEMAHIRHRHSIDLLVADICIFFQWFNPGAWLLKQELQNIHEYEADETVINEGVNAKDYQLLLIKKAVGIRLYSMANSFNHSKLKKRITMMLKEKSSPWARLKYLYVLPLAAIAVTAFARPEISEKAEEISAVEVNDLVSIMQEDVLGDTVKVSNDTLTVKKSKAIGIGGNITKDNESIVSEIVEQMPEYPGGMNAFLKYLRDKTENSSVKGKTGGSVIVSFTVSETGKVINVKASKSDSSLLSKEAERIVREMPDWIPGKQNGNSVPVLYSISITFSKNGKLSNKVKVMSFSKKETSDTNAAKSTVSRYISCSDDADGQRSTDSEDVGLASEASRNLTNTLTLSSELKGSRELILDKIKDGEPPLFIIDGKETFDADALSEIPIARVKSFSILKDKSSTDVYGDKGKNGVVIIDLFSDKEYRAKMKDASRVKSESTKSKEDTKGKEDAVIDEEKDKDKEEPLVYINDTEVKGLKSISILGGYGTVNVDDKTGKRIIHIYTKQ